jgi:hypothetical protein
MTSDAGMTSGCTIELRHFAFGHRYQYWPLRPYAPMSFFGSLKTCMAATVMSQTWQYARGRSHLFQSGVRPNDLSQ